MKKFLFLLLFAHQFTCSAIIFKPTHKDTSTQTTIVNNANKIDWGLNLEKKLEGYGVVSFCCAAISLLIVSIPPNSNSTLFNPKESMASLFGFFSFLFAIKSSARFVKDKSKFYGKAYLFAAIGILVSMAYYFTH